MGRQQPAGGPPHRAVCFVEAQMISELNQRSRDIFRTIVDAYVETGEPIGSRTISRRLGISLSPATIRNVMADLEDLGLLYSPHTSAGRLPTEAGLRLFVHGLLEVGALSEQERENINVKCATSSRSLPRSAGRSLVHAVRPVELRRPGAGAQDRPDAEAYRVRQSRPRPRAGGAGDGGRAGREPGDRSAAGHAGFHASDRVAIS